MCKPSQLFFGLVRSQSRQRLSAPFPASIQQQIAAGVVGSRDVSHIGINQSVAFAAREERLKEMTVAQMQFGIFLPRVQEGGEVAASEEVGWEASPLM